MIMKVLRTQKMLSLPVQKQCCLWMQYKRIYLRTAKTAHMSAICNEMRGKRTKRALNLAQDWASLAAEVLDVLKGRARKRKFSKKQSGLSVAAPLTGPKLKRTSAIRRSDSSGSVVGFMLNFGLSGGMNPTGSNLAVQRCFDFGFYAASLKAKWGFAVGCRRPIGVSITKAIRSFPWIVTGHESIHYDAVSLFISPDVAPAIVWLSHMSFSTRSLWVDVGGVEIWSCLYLPPSSSVDMQTRKALVAMYFHEWDQMWEIQKKRATKSGWSTTMHGCGDLNPCPELMRIFQGSMMERGIVWASDTSVPTHSKGNTLDFV